jgi:hypothetical protein
VAGGFHAISPTRVYDSRVPAPIQGTITAGVNRTVSVAAGRDITTGAVVVGQENIVPAGATAITCNVTVVNTVSAGFLALNPGGNLVVAAASVNWSASGQILNNGINATLNGSRELSVIAGGNAGALTDFVIDVTGYYL